MRKKITSVLVVARGPRFGGMERYTYNLVESLLERGIHVALVTSDGPFVNRFSPAVKVYVMPLERKESIRRPVEKRILEIAKEHGAQIIHAQCRIALLNSTPAARSLNIPVLSHEHNLYEEREYAFVLGELNASADHVLTIGHNVRNALIGHGLAKERSSVVYHGIEMREFKPITPAQRRESRKALKLSPEDRVVLCVSRIVRDKGILELIRSFDAVRRNVPNAKLLIVGGNSDDRCDLEAEKLIEHLGLQKHAFIYPPELDVRKYFAASDVFCHPAINRGLSVMEAMAAGLPIVGKRGAERPIVAQEGVHCLTTGRASDPAFDEQALAEKLAFLLSQPRIARAMGKAARERIEKHFSMRAHVQKMLRIYRDAIRKKSYEAYSSALSSESMLELTSR